MAGVEACQYHPCRERSGAPRLDDGVVGYLICSTPLGFSECGSAIITMSTMQQQHQHKRTKKKKKKIVAQEMGCCGPRAAADAAGTLCFGAGVGTGCVRVPPYPLACPSLAKNNRLATQQGRREALFTSARAFAPNNFIRLLTHSQTYTHSPLSSSS
jgi:hypothetical protein